MEPTLSISVSQWAAVINMSGKIKAVGRKKTPHPQLDYTDKSY
ncbi:MAG: hypothetical protein RR846_06945 [Oscillospiraceae bacterium]